MHIFVCFSLKLETFFLKTSIITHEKLFRGTMFFFHRSCLFCLSLYFFLLLLGTASVFLCKSFFFFPFLNRFEEWFASKRVKFTYIFSYRYFFVMIKFYAQVFFYRMIIPPSFSYFFIIRYSFYFSIIIQLSTGMSTSYIQL